METLDEKENKILNIMNRKRPSSKTAEGVALYRLGESIKPEDERICYDPYAIYFINPDILEFVRNNPEKVKADAERYERFLPGMVNSGIARVRYFDDFVGKSADEGLEQLIILGAGYDTRAYRIEGLKAIKVFEVDHPDTQNLKIETIRKIFNSLPDHVAYVPIDLATENPDQKLQDAGYNKSEKTLFLMEGLLYYLPPKVVDEILAFIRMNAGTGSSILFDYLPESVIDGSCELEVGRNIHNHLAQVGEPLKFGIKEGTIETFLTKRGFSEVQNVTAEEYKKMYFHGINKDRNVCNLLYFTHAIIE
ncbi:methyltransferase [Methanosarcina spelaei]|uniref:Methyltransferase n=1 Tax=Methanosarcina spelaei TaxID=1036679 RepID=A0A2A2HVS9_9EURY|nr:class I SAM-dependent methyltransferase [Methanosarcina spelaei]PAV13609.1 methyltransferase [Methanosarcina spelaei]